MYKDLNIIKIIINLLLHVSLPYLNNPKFEACSITFLFD